MKFSSILILGAAVSANAFGWGCEGHEAVALIAGAHLTAKVRTLVYQLLKDNPIDPALSRFCKPIPADAMAFAATWADDAKKTEKTGVWHYIDIPRGAEHADIMKYCAAIGESKDGKDRPGCPLTALPYEIEILKDRGRPAADRARALRYVIHLVGDMHQPLHNITNDDDGGNCTSLTLLGNPKPGQLHGAWDYGMIQNYMKEHNQTPETMATDLDQRFHKKGRKWLHERIDFTEWSKEGFELAEKVAYNKLRPKPAVEPADNPPGCPAEREKTKALKIDINGKYVHSAMPVIEKQLAKAGYHLADVLNSALAQ